MYLFTCMSCDHYIRDHQTHECVIKMTKILISNLGGGGFGCKKKSLGIFCFYVFRFVQAHKTMIYYQTHADVLLQRTDCENIIDIFLISDEVWQVTVSLCSLSWLVHVCFMLIVLLDMCVFEAVISVWDTGQNIIRSRQ